MISKLSETFKNAGRIDESIELGERLRLRRKQNIPNLLNLAECYRMQNQIERANLLLKDVLAFDKENKIAKDMISKLV